LLVHSSKLRLNFNGLHGAISQKIELFREISCSCRRWNSNSSVVSPAA
jgi:hypothetical protein